MESVKLFSIIRIIILVLGSVMFAVIMIYNYFQYRKQSKLTEAFFKFEKADIDEKIK